MRVGQRLASVAAALALAVGLAGWAAPGAAQSDDASLGEGFLAAPVDDDGQVQEGRLSPDSIATVTRLEAYLNQISTVRARFVQISTNGNFAEGDLYLERPGRVRFEYDDPHPVLLVSDGNQFLYYDKELKNATFIPLEDSPLWFLIREKVSLTDAVEITRLIEENATITLTVTGEGTGDLGDVTLIFADRPLELKKWVVTDADGLSIQVALIAPEFSVAIDEEIFEYDDLDVYGFRNRERAP